MTRKCEIVTQDLFLVHWLLLFLRLIFSLSILTRRFIGVCPQFLVNQTQMAKHVARAQHRNLNIFAP